VEYTDGELQAMPPGQAEAFRRHEAALTGPPYLCLAVVVAAIAVAIARTDFAMPPLASVEQAAAAAVAPLVARESAKSWGPTLLALARVGWQLWPGAVAQCCYVGAQVGVWSFLIRYVQAARPGTPERVAASFITVSLVLFAGGRFAASALLRRGGYPPAGVLAACAVVATALCLLAVLLPRGDAAIGSVCLVSAAMAPMYPIIFSLTLARAADEDKGLAASLLVMMIVGGAVVTPLLAAVSDLAGIRVAYVVPAGCFIVVAGYGYNELTRGAREEPASYKGGQHGGAGSA